MPPLGRSSVHVTDAPTYVPYYDVDSPLHSIDWGTQVDGTSRNPDGEEGPRITGNAFTGTAWNPYGIEGKNVITVYFGAVGIRNTRERLHVLYGDRGKIDLDDANPGLAVRLTLPAEVRAALNVDQGDQVVFVETAPGRFEVKAEARAAALLSPRQHSRLAVPVPGPTPQMELPIGGAPDEPASR